MRESSENEEVYFDSDDSNEDTRESIASSSSGSDDSDGSDSEESEDYFIIKKEPVTDSSFGEDCAKPLEPPNPGTQKLIPTDPSSAMPSPDVEISFQTDNNEPPFPSHLLEFLKTWHKENGNRKPPPCLTSLNKQKEHKVYNRKCEQVKLIGYTITKPMSYVALVLQVPGEPEKLVAATFGPRKGSSFLVAWTGTGETFETSCCAARVFKPDSGQIQCSEKVWEDAPLKPRATTCPGPKLEPSPSPAEYTPPDPSPPRDTKPMMSLRKRNRRSVFERAPATPESSIRAGSIADSDTREREIEKEASPPTSPKKRRKVESKKPPAVKPDISFKLQHYRSNSIQRVPLEECKTGDQLFSKARLFFQSIPSFDRNPDVSLLSCQISPHSAQQFVSKGSEGEFQYLIEDAKELQNSTQERVVIEVVYGA